MPSPARVLPTPADLDRHFRQKYGDPVATGPNPRLHYRAGYFTPADVYEATVANAVFPGCHWLDVGGGSSPFPDNPKLAAEATARAGRTAGVDPSPNIHSNPYLAERHQGFIEDYRPAAPFDLATLRMVAEHVTDPPAVVAALARLVRPGGRVIVYTVNLISPITLVSRFTPFGAHHPVKELLWGGEEKDTFPTAYKMNTRRELRRLFARGGFRESEFADVDDCCTLYRFPRAHAAELLAWRAFRAVGLRYPEANLLGVYVRTDPGAA
jgi:SAM-dependent methyltransferase